MIVIFIDITNKIKIICVPMCVHIQKIYTLTLIDLVVNIHLYNIGIGFYVIRV